MKKLLLLIPLLLLLCACGAPTLQEANTGMPTETAAPATTQDPIVRVTFPEGYTTVQIAERLEENGVCAAKDFMEAVRSAAEEKENYACLANVDFSGRAFALEGYVFPDTYDFYRGESAGRALSRFLANANSKLTAEFADRAKALGYTLDEIVTIASIIQEEAGDPAEMGKVSSVLHNRLESPDYGMLQCDVTINYVNDCITDSPYLTGDDTSQYAARYNTYKVRGLPVGAICCPGIEAIRAALYPEETDYFFFVTDSEMNYYYAATYAEHLENCKICGIS